MNSKDWNPRYVAFAASRGREPQEELDFAFGPKGNRMADFTIWVSKQLAAFCESRGIPRDRIQITLGDGFHAEFTSWLESVHNKEPSS